MIEKIKVLNLYAGIGGNRKLWKNVEVTAVENNHIIAQIYSHFFPEDTVIVGDAHEYLRRNYKRFDFIWSSPPCQTHSRMRKAAAGTKFEEKYPDMRLYEEIIFLLHHAPCKWVVENVKGYYEPLIRPQEVGRHFLWANFKIAEINVKGDIIETSNIKRLEENKGFNLDFVKGLGKRKDQVLKNCVNSELGLHILRQAFVDKQEKLIWN